MKVGSALERNRRAGKLDVAGRLTREVRLRFNGGRKFAEIESIEGEVDIEKRIRIERGQPGKVFANFAGRDRQENIPRQSPTAVQTEIQVLHLKIIFGDIDEGVQVGVLIPEMELAKENVARRVVRLQFGIE